jgi:hypothetical protein
MDSAYDDPIIASIEAEAKKTLRMSVSVNWSRCLLCPTQTNVASRIHLFTSGEDSTGAFEVSADTLR